MKAKIFILVALMLFCGKAFAWNDYNTPNYTYVHISTQATTIIHTSTAVLHSITINKPTASSVITIYDSATAANNVVGIITLPATLLSEGPMTAIFDVSCPNGLTIVTGTAASDITVAYR
jgi:hypothetical protein